MIMTTVMKMKKPIFGGDDVMAMAMLMVIVVVMVVVIVMLLAMPMAMLIVMGILKLLMLRVMVGMGKGMGMGMGMGCNRGPLVESLALLGSCAHAGAAMAHPTRGPRKCNVHI